MAVAQTTTAITADNSISYFTATTSRRAAASGAVLGQTRHSVTVIPEIVHHHSRVVGALAKLVEKYMLVWALLMPYALIMRLSDPTQQRAVRSPKWRRRRWNANSSSETESVVVEDSNVLQEQFTTVEGNDNNEEKRNSVQPKKEHFKGKEPEVDGLKEEEPRMERSLINLSALACDEPHAVASVDGDSMGGSTWTVLSETSESHSSERDEPNTVVITAAERSASPAFNDLPLKVQRRIFSYLDYSPAELWNLRRVCRTWRTQVHALTSEALEGAFIRSGATAQLLLTLHHNETATPQRLRHRLRLAAISHDGRAVFKVASADRRTTLMQGVRFVDVSMRVSAVSTSSSSDNHRMRVEVPVGRIAMHTGVFDACSHYVSLDCVTCSEPWSQMLNIHRIKLGMPLILRRMGIRVVAGRTSASTKKRT